MNDDTIISGLQDAREAKVIALATKEAVEKGFGELKASFRFDCQSIMNNDVKLAIYEALEKHHSDKVIPLFRENLNYCKTENEALHERINKPEAVANFFTSIYTFIIGTPALVAAIYAIKNYL